jgi:hypothetical protein
LGFPINYITADTHQSAEMLQTLGTYGFVTEFLSIDRNRQPYDNLVQCFMQNRIHCFPYTLLSEEYKSLEKKGDKIIKARYGTDDVVQAVAGSVWNCLKITPPLVDPPEIGELIGDFDFDIDDTESSSATII